MPTLLVLWVLSADPAVTVTGTALRHHTTNPCMGGVRVTEDMIRHERAPLPQQPLTFIEGNSPFGTVVARAKTDAGAAFRVSLPPGTYCVVFGEPPQPPPPPAPKDAGVGEPVVAVAAGPYNPDCMRALQHPTPQCATVLAVPAGGLKKATLERSTFNQCGQQWAHPCWRGPMPP